MRMGHTEAHCLAAEDLQALGWDFRPRSHLWSSLHFRFVLKCVCVSECISLPVVFLPLPTPSPPQKIPATVEPHWEYCASQFGDLSWQSRRTVERWRPGCGLNLFNLHHCPQWRSWPTIALPPKFLHPPFVSPERWEKLVRFCQLAKARPPSCSQLPVSWHGGGRCRNGQVWFAITLEEQLLPGISTPPDRYGEKSKATFQIRPNLKRRVA